MQYQRVGYFQQKTIKIPEKPSESDNSDYLEKLERENQRRFELSEAIKNRQY